MLKKTKKKERKNENMLVLLVTGFVKYFRLCFFIVNKSKNIIKLIKNKKEARKVILINDDTEYFFDIIE